MFAVSSYKARNDFIRAIHHMIHDSVCHAGFQTVTTLAGLQVVTPLMHHQHQQQQHSPSAHQHQHPVTAAVPIYGEAHAQGNYLLGNVHCSSNSPCRVRYICSKIVNMHSNKMPGNICEAFKTV